MTGAQGRAVVLDDVVELVDELDGAAVDFGVAKPILTTVPCPFAVSTPMTQVVWPAVPQ